MINEGAALIPAQRLALVLLYGYEAQAVLDGEEAVDFDPAAALATGEFEVVHRRGNVVAWERRDAASAWRIEANLGAR